MYFLAVVTTKSKNIFDACRNYGLLSVHSKCFLNYRYKEKMYPAVYKSGRDRRPSVINISVILSTKIPCEVRHRLTHHAQRKIFDLAIHIFVLLGRIILYCIVSHARIRSPANTTKCISALPAPLSFPLTLFSSLFRGILLPRPFCSSNPPIPLRKMSNYLRKGRIVCINKKNFAPFEKNSTRRN